MDPFTKTCMFWTINYNYFKPLCKKTGCSLEDMTEAIDDRDKLREIEREERERERESWRNQS